MNRIYRLIWNANISAWVVVPEFAKARGKRSSGTISLVLALNGLIYIGQAYALGPSEMPGGGQIISGSGSISQSGNQMIVHQTTPKLSANWESFNIGKDAHVQFQQPGTTSIAINRIGGQQASDIQGKLDANGQVYLINPNGVVFAKTAEVNVGGLLASTKTLSTADLNTGKASFTGNSTAGITNQGQINASHGMVALIADKIDNQGRITVINGDVVLAAGDKVQMDFDGDGLIKLEVDAAAVQTQISNQGLIQADGAVIMTAQAAGELVGSVVSNQGIIQAQGLHKHQGRILLDAEKVINDGSLDVSNANGQGGDIRVTANNIQLQSHSRLDADGSQGGGNILVGGDWQGSDNGRNSMRQAETVAVAEGAEIHASGTGTGDGGKVVLWSDVNKANSQTSVQGDITARGGAFGGNGGKVETSGHQLVLGGNVKVNVGASLGQGGEWLLDPADVTISNTADTNHTGFVPNSGVTSTNIDVNTLVTALNMGGNVTVTTANTGAAGAGVGNLTVADSIITGAMAVDGTLTLKAHNDITLNNGVSIDATQNGNTHKLNVVLNADQDGDGAGGIVLNNGSRISSNGGNITLGGGSAGDGSGYAVGDLASGYGIFLGTANINGGGGNIVLHGQGYAGAGNLNHGVMMTGGSITSAGNGVVSLTGLGGGTGTSGYDYGVLIDDGAVITSGSGNVNVTGTGGSSSGAKNVGVLVSGIGTQIRSGVTGRVNVIGVGGGIDASSYNFGVLVDSGGEIISTGGDISIIGTGGDSGGNGNDNYGVLLANEGAIIGMGVGTVVVQGTGGFSNGDNNNGVRVSLTGTSIISGGSGTVTVTGGGGGIGASAYNNGILVDGGAAISSGGGNVDVQGTGGATSGDNSIGVQVANSGTLISSGGSGTVSVTGLGGGSAGSSQNFGVLVETSAAITSGGGNLFVTGTGGDTGGSGYLNHGVYLATGSTISAGATGLTSVTGFGGAASGDSSYGVWVADSGSNISSVDGAVSVTGTGGGIANSGDNSGVKVSRDGMISSGGGTVTVTGTGGSPSGSTNHGVSIDSAGIISAGGSGSVNVRGFGGASAGDYNFGVYVTDASSSILSTAGNVDINGTGGGTASSIGNDGVLVNAGAVIKPGGSGSLVVTGVGGTVTAGNNNHGIYAGGVNTLISSSGGNVSVQGTAGGIGGSASNYGIQIDGAAVLSAGGGGSLTVLGQGGDGAGTGSSNIGVYVVGGGSIAPAGSGALNLTGIGGAAGNSNYGVYVTGSSSILSSADGNVSVTGLGNGTGSGNGNYGVYVDGGVIKPGGNGALSVTGTGATSVTGDYNYGVQISGNTGLVGAAAGNVDIVGAAGNGANSYGIEFDTDAVIEASGTARVSLSTDSFDWDGTGYINNSTGTVVIQNRSAGTHIDLGGADVLGASPLVLGLLDRELSHVLTDTLVIGRNDGIAVGQFTASGDIFPETADKLVLLSGGDIAINSALSISNTLVLTPGIGANLTGTGIVSAHNLLLKSSGANYTLANANVDIVAAEGVARLSLENLGALAIGSIGAINGISASGAISVSTSIGDLTVSQAVSTSDSSSTAIQLNAGAIFAPGNPGNGNLLIFASVNTGSGGRATLMSGSVYDSTGLTDLVGSGSGRFRYYSDEAISHYSAPLGSGLYAIYRESPLVFVTANDSSKAYDAQIYSGGNGYSLSGQQNGDTNTDVLGNPVYGGSAQGAKNVGIYGMTITGTNLLGYDLNPVPGSLVINPANLVLTGSQVYNGGTVFSGSHLLAVGVGGEIFSISGAGATGNLASKDVQTQQALASLTGLSLGNSNNGGLASNYLGLTEEGSSVSVIPADLVLSGSQVYNGGTAVLGSHLTATGVAGEIFSVIGSGAMGNLAAKDVQNQQTLASVGGLSLGNSNNGGLGRNYHALSTAGSSISVTPADLVLAGSQVYNGSTAILGSNLTATGVAGETFSIIGSGANGNLASKDVQNAQPLLNLAGLSLGNSSNGGLGSNYHPLSTSGSSFSVTRLPEVRWIGPAKGGDWLDPSNWVGGAVPDHANVANVLIDNGSSPVFGRNITEPVMLESIGSQSGGLTVIGGTLLVGSGGIRLGAYSQTGGVVTSQGNTKLSYFNQTGGLFNGHDPLMENVDPHQQVGETIYVSQSTCPLANNRRLQTAANLSSDNVPLIIGQEQQDPDSPQGQSQQPGIDKALAGLCVGPVGSPYPMMAVP